jgi:hypothetical protein
LIRFAITGDLPGGYRWGVFPEIAKKMDWLRFYVPGNHDLSSNRMRRFGEKRFGKAWYAFNQKDVIFMDFHTEAGASGRISP